MLPEFTTERLRLRTPSWADEDYFYQMGSDPQVMQYISAGKLQSREEAKKDLARRIEAAANGRLGYWVIETLADNKFVGWACLHSLDKSEEVEIGYRLLPEFWGQGIATQASERLLHYGFTEFSLDRIVGICLPENQASRRVLEKLGLRFKKETVYYGFNVVYLALDRNDWEIKSKPLQP